jgi:aerobic C4-dicarboxylate transport protein
LRWTSSPRRWSAPSPGDNILQVLLVAVLFGIGAGHGGSAGAPVLNFLEALTTPVFKVVGILMKAAPIGAFGAMAFTIGKFGLGVAGATWRGWWARSTSPRCCSWW